LKRGGGFDYCLSSGNFRMEQLLNDVSYVFGSVIRRYSHQLH